jgi:hypothetical protein
MKIKRAEFLNDLGDTYVFDAITLPYDIGFEEVHNYLLRTYAGDGRYGVDAVLLSVFGVYSDKGVQPYTYYYTSDTDGVMIKGWLETKVFPGTEVLGSHEVWSDTAKEKIKTALENKE